jgi:hypothetical protein
MEGRFTCSRPAGHTDEHRAFWSHAEADGICWYGPWKDGRHFDIPENMVEVLTPCNCKDKCRKARKMEKVADKYNATVKAEREIRREER